MKKSNRIFSKKTIIFWAMLLLVTFTTLSINNYLSNTNLRSLASIQTKTINPSELSIGIATNNPPFEFAHGSSLVGFEVDLMREIANRLNLSIKFIPMSKDKLLAGLKHRAFDAAIGGFDISESEADIAYSNSYLSTHVCIFINKNAEPPIKNIQDLSNKTIGVFFGSTAYLISMKMKQEKQIGSIKTYPPDQFLTLIDDLYHQNISGAMQVVLAAKYYTYLFPNIGILNILPDTYPIGIAFNSNHIDAIALTNQVLFEMRKDGTLHQLSIKWFGNTNNGSFK